MCAAERRHPGHDAERPATTPPKAQQLIDAGMQLMYEHYADTDHTLGAGFQFVSPTQVAARAGISKGMLYHIWGRDGGRAFDNYVAELAGRVLEPLARPDLLTQALSELHERGTPFAQTIALMGEFELDSMVTDEQRRVAFAQQLSLVAYAGSRVIREALETSNQRSYEQLAEFYDFALALYGKRLRRHDGHGRSMTSVDLARAVSCLVEGFASDAMHHPDLTEPVIAWSVDGRREPSSLLAIALVALIDGVTEDIPRPTPRTPDRPTAGGPTRRTRRQP
jgi:AcrR family transcriptional regulator